MENHIHSKYLGIKPPFVILLQEDGIFMAGESIIFCQLLCVKNYVWIHILLNKFPNSSFKDPNLNSRIL